MPEPGSSGHAEIVDYVGAPYFLIVKDGELGEGSRRQIDDEDDCCQLLLLHPLEDAWAQPNGMSVSVVVESLLQINSPCLSSTAFLYSANDRPA